PDLDGIAATAAIRERETSLGTRLTIVAMTAHALKGDRERCLAAGMDGYLPKPLRAVDLAAALERFGGSAGLSLQRDEKPLLGQTELLRHLEGDREMLGHLAVAFIEECPDLVADLRQAQRANDRDALRRTAHKIRGVAGAL